MTTPSNFMSEPIKETPIINKSMDPQPLPYTQYLQGLLKKHNI